MPVRVQWVIRPTTLLQCSVDSEILSVARTTTPMDGGVCRCPTNEGFHVIDQVIAGEYVSLCTQRELVNACCNGNGTLSMQSYGILITQFRFLCC